MQIQEKITSREIDIKLLSTFFMDVFCFDVVKYSEKSFSSPDAVSLFKVLRTFVKSGAGVVPTKDTIRHYIESGLSNTDSNTSIQALSALDDITPIQQSEVSYYRKAADNLAKGRELFDTVGFIKDTLISTTDFDAGLRSLFARLISMSVDKSEGVDRGNIFDDVKARFEQYQVVRDSRDGHAGVIPYGIASIDSVLNGGMAKSFVSLIVSKTGGGKSRFLVNTAINAASRGHKVMYISLEMSRHSISTVIDSNISRLNSADIFRGKLSNDDETTYKETLKGIHKTKFPIYVVDIQDGCTPIRIRKEIEAYKSLHGYLPDLLVIDYSQLIDLDEKYSGGRSEKYDIIFKQLHQLAKFYNLALLTAAQESRTAQQNSIKKGASDESAAEEGVIAISSSHFIAVHCEQIIRLLQDSTDKAANRITAVIIKNRYGNLHSGITLMCDFSRSFFDDIASKDVP